MERRAFLRGLGGLLIAAPAIVRASSLMPVRMVPFEFSSTVPTLVDWSEKLTEFQIQYRQAPIDGYLDETIWARTVSCCFVKGDSTYFIVKNGEVHLVKM